MHLRNYDGVFFRESIVNPLRILTPTVLLIVCAHFGTIEKNK